MPLTMPKTSPNFNPRSPRGERQHCKDIVSEQDYYFNPRSPRGERQYHFILPIRVITFQSTLPARGATNYLKNLCILLIISIHAPREGSDIPIVLAGAAEQDFNPRSPRGERHPATVRESRRYSHFNPRSPRGERPRPLPKEEPQQQLQSTLPARGATIQ